MTPSATGTFFWGRVPKFKWALERAKKTVFEARGKTRNRRTMHYLVGGTGESKP